MTPPAGCTTTTSSALPTSLGAAGTHNRAHYDDAVGFIARASLHPASLSQETSQLMHQKRAPGLDAGNLFYFGQSWGLGKAQSRRLIRHQVFVFFCG